MNRTSRHRGGISLLEMMIVVALIAVLAGLIIPNSGTDVVQQLESTARIIEADIAYCQSLSISNNSTYRLAFSVIPNRYTLKHMGASASLDVLPDGVFESNYTSTIRRTELSDLSSMGPEVRLTPAPDTVTFLEFGPLGETTSSGETVIWIECGSSSDRRYLSITVNPVTGMTKIGDIQTSAP